MHGQGDDQRPHPDKKELARAQKEARGPGPPDEDPAGHEQPPEVEVGDFCLAEGKDEVGYITDISPDPHANRSSFQFLKSRLKAQLIERLT